MLYVTSRNRTDSFTAHRALHEAFAPDGGAFLPMRIPQYGLSEIENLKEMNFSEAVAQQLNRFFSVSVTGWDVEFAIGKNPYSVVSFGRKIYCGRLWHNKNRCADYVMGRLNALICSKAYDGTQPDGWAALAIQIAVLFGFATEILKQGNADFDVAVSADDFDSVFAAWYAKAMGLPVRTVICGCSRNSDAWGLIQKGECNASALHAVSGIEKLIYCTLGLEENLRYLSSKGIYKIDALKFNTFNDGLYAAVIGQKRTEAVMHSLFRTDKLLVDPDVAVAYSALQDHRAKTGESRPTLMLSFVAPELCKNVILSATGISEAEFKKSTDLL